MSTTFTPTADQPITVKERSVQIDFPTIATIEGAEIVPVLSVFHDKYHKQLVGQLRQVKRSYDRGFQVEAYMLFDTVTVARQPIARWSKNAAIELLRKLVPEVAVSDDPAVVAKLTVVQAAEA